MLTIAEQPQSEVTALIEGELLLYQGPSGTQPNSLQNGQWYTVHIVDQSNLAAITIQLKTTSQSAGYGTLTGSAGSYIIHESDADGTVWLSQVGSAEALTTGATVTFTGTSGTGASFLQNGQIYSVIVVSQDSPGTSTPDPGNIQIELALYQLPTYGTLAGSGHSFTIGGIDSSSQTVTLSEIVGATVTALTEGESLVYTGASVPGTELLQSGKTYTVHILDQSNPGSILVQLLDPTGPDVADSSTAGIDPLSNAVVLDSSQTLIPNGTIVTYHAGGADTEIGGLQDGVSYQAVVDSTNPTVMHLEQIGGQPVELTLNETLTGNGNSYIIIGSDGIDHTIAVVTPQGSTPNLSEGEAVTYAGALGAATGSMVDGQTYYVHIPDTSDPTTIQLLLSPTATTPLAIQTAISLGTVDLAYMSGTDTLTPLSLAGIQITATLSSSESLSVWSGIGGEAPIKEKLLPVEAGRAAQGFVVSIFSGQGANAHGQVNPPSQDLIGTSPIPFAVTGSFLVEEITNSAVAEVGANAILTDTGAITVSSLITENNQTGDSSTSSLAKNKDSTKENKQVAVAVGILYDSLSNTSHALLDGGSQVDAGGAMSVSAQITYPWVGQINNPNGFDPAATFGSDIGTNTLKFFDNSLGFRLRWSITGLTRRPRPRTIPTTLPSPDRFSGPTTPMIARRASTRAP